MTFRCVRCKREIDKSFRACPHCGEPVTEFLRRYAEEPVDGKYQIVERLGAGGMGEVYKVTHIFLGTTRVIKVIRPQISESTDAHDRFLREARAATKVQHPNVATLHDFAALPDGSHYMVWEYIEGENIAQRIRARGTLPPRYAVMLTIQALHGLEAIHRAGIIHRDISPENIMVTRETDGDDRVKIIDLGVAKVEDSGTQATRAGVFVGKLRYASPEHLGFLADGEKIDGRADVYSMGMVLYEMLTGRPPFEATSPHEYVLMHSRDTQFKPLDLAVNLPGGEALQAAVARALERDRNKRFSSAKEFATALEEVEKSLPDPTAVRTLSVARPDTDETMLQTPLPDTLHRETVRSAVGTVPAAETVRTPFPGAAPQQAAAVAAKSRSGTTVALAIVAVVIVAALGAIGFMLISGHSVHLLTRAGTTTATRAPLDQPRATRAPAVAPQTTVDVVPPASTTTTTAAITTTTASPEITQTVAEVPTVTAAPQRPKPVVVAEKRKAVEPARAEAPAPAVDVHTYVEGGDAGANEAALADLRQQVRGVTRIALRGNSDMLKDLGDRLKNDGGVTISDSADVVVNFYGTVERLGLGRKRRSAHVTILKNGSPVFKYELPPEEYRVGDNPAEAFARVLIDALH